MLFVAVDLEGFAFSCSQDGDALRLEVHFQFCFGICFNSGEDLIEELRADLYGQDADVQGVVLEDVCKEAGHYATEAVIIDSPGCVLAAAAAAEVLTAYQDLAE